MRRKRRMQRRKATDLMRLLLELGRLAGEARPARNPSAV